MFFIQNIQILLEINVIYHLKNLQMVEFFCAAQKNTLKNMPVTFVQILCTKINLNKISYLIFSPIPQK